VPIARAEAGPGEAISIKCCRSRRCGPWCVTAPPCPLAASPARLSRLFAPQGEGDPSAYL